MTNCYSSYQNSQLPWIDKIPSHWKWLRNGILLNNHCEKVGDQYSQYQLLSLTTKGIKEKNINDNTGKVPDSYDGYQKVYPGDMVFCLFDLDCSAVFSGLSDYNGMITSAYDVAKPNEDIVSGNYLKYWFDAVFFGRYYKIYSKSVRYTINYDVFRTIKCPIPPMTEQIQIVRYLEWKTFEIDKFIHEKNKQIKLLKDIKQIEIDRLVLRGTREHQVIRTNIMGLEEIPEDWTILRNKNLFYERSEYSTTGEERLLSVSKHFGVKPSDLLSENEQFATIKPAESLVGYKIVKKNDLVMNIMRARNGSYGISNYDGIVSAAYCVYGLKVRCNPRYIHFLLRSPHIISTYEAYAYGICEHRRRLYADDFLRLYSVLPDIDEQNEIVSRIDELEHHNNLAIEQVSKEIELLKELRTKIIADVVTGQIDVRKVIIPDYDKETIDEEDEIDTDSEDSDDESEDEE